MIQKSITDKIFDYNGTEELEKGTWGGAGCFFSKRLYFFKMDQSSLEDCKKFCVWFKAKFNKLNIALMNAGLIVPTEKYTKEGFEFSMGVNHFAHFYLTSELLPLIKSTPKSRVLVTSSISQNKGGGNPDPYIKLDDIYFKKDPKLKTYDSWHRYGASKFANVVFVTALAKFFEREGINAKAASFRPGITRTGFQENIKGIKGVLVSCFRCYLKSQTMGAQTGIHLTYQDYDKVINGEFYDNCELGKKNPDGEPEKYWKGFWNVSIDEVERVGYPCANFKKL